MSFSREVKEELSGRAGEARHCQLAELAAIVNSCGNLVGPKGQPGLEIMTENEIVARKCFTLLEKAFNIENVEIFAEAGKLLISEKQGFAEQVCQALKLSQDADGGLLVSGLLTQNTCCKRAFIRGAFLAAGSMSDPEKGYHLEFVFPIKDKAEQLREMLQFFDVDAKIVIRKKYYVVYVKEGSQIVDVLNVMEAHTSLMELENVRILKGVRNSVNRQVNCEAANINKTVHAAAKQIDDIIYIRDTLGFHTLTEGLEEIAVLRIQYPEASLKELGEMLSVPLGKSGVNHRLKKLSSIAEALREEKEEQV